ncbi:MAG: paraquat-inducible protein A [Pseudomonadota bacterium]
MATHFPSALVFANLALLVVFPLSWFAPLMRAGLLPIFGLDEITILSGIASLWEEEKALAALVVVFALVAPIGKTLALTALHIGRLGSRALPFVSMLGKLAMADVFLIALYVVLARGQAIGRLETAWGLWLFTAAVLTSLALALWTERLAKAPAAG